MVDEVITKFIMVPQECADWVRLLSGYTVGYDVRREKDENGNIFYKFKLERVI